MQNLNFATTYLIFILPCNCISRIVCQKRFALWTYIWKSIVNLTITHLEIKKFKDFPSENFGGKRRMMMMTLSEGAWCSVLYIASVALKNNLFHNINMQWWLSLRNMKFPFCLKLSSITFSYTLEISRDDKKR